MSLTEALALAESKLKEYKLTTNLSTTENGWKTISGANTHILKREVLLEGEKRIFTVAVAESNKIWISIEK